jgi:phosphatidylinositol glycan class B
MWLVFFAWRLFWSLGTRTAFVPDEYFQSVEVAHALVFGDGSEQLTWEWTAARPVRSSLHALLFAAPLWLLRITGLDGREAVVASPLVLQAAMAATTDALVVATATAWHGREGGKWSALLHATSWAVTYCGARTLSNNVESLLVLLALWLLTQRREQSAVAAMVVCFAVRPSSAVYWPFWILSLPLSTLPRTLALVIPVALLTAACTVAIDSFFYGRWTVTPLNFVLFNLASSSHYGTHPWHWYFSSGLPTLAGPLLPLLAAAMWNARRRWQFWAFCVVAPALLSIVPHKEFRFLLPSLSVAIALAGPVCARAWSSRSLRVLFVASVVANVALVSYVSFVHQRGPVVATDYLRAHAQPGSRICYGTPCHALPAHARLHVPGAVVLSLECDPPADGSATRYTPSDVFFREFSPGRLRDLLVEWRCDWVAAFEPVAAHMPRVEWRLELEAFHAHIPSDSRHGNAISVFSRVK